MPLKKDCDMALSEKSRAILQAIAEGHTYEQILVQDLAWTYHDIFQAAAEALEAPQATNEVKSYDVEEIRQEHPRAYEKWSAQEDEQLSGLCRNGAIGEWQGPQEAIQNGMVEFAGHDARLVHRQPDPLIEAAEHGSIGDVRLRRRVEMEDLVHNFLVRR